MRIDATRPAHTPAPPVRRTAAEDASSPTPAPAPTATEKHGRGAEHRSDVATLRQWVNHPERRESITLPDLESTSGSKGFANALAAYRAVLAELAPPSAPTPPVEEQPTPTDPVEEAPVDLVVAEPTDAPVES